MLVLPVEVWEHIFDLMAVDYAHSVVFTTSRGHFIPSPFPAICQTCRSWLPKGRLHLFTVVALKDGGTLQRFRNSLDANPANGHAVRSLRLGASRIVGSVVHEDPATPWISAVSLMLSSRVLPNVDDLYVYGLDLSQVHANFYRNMSLFSSNLRSVYLDYLHSSVDQLARFLLHLPTLTSLTMLWDGPMMRTSRSPIPLRSGTVLGRTGPLRF